jgi:hypothetical protein
MIPWISLVFVVISSFLFQILLIWVFALQGLVNLVYFFKEPPFCFGSFYVFFFVVLYFITFLPLFLLFLSFCLFWVFLVLVFLGVWDVTLGHLFENFWVSFNICTHGYSLSSEDCLCCVPQVLVDDVFIFISFEEPFDFLPISPMTYRWLSKVLFGLQLFVHFLLLFLLLSSSFIALWSDRIQEVISIFLYLLRLALCPKIWPSLEKVSWAAEENVYGVEVGWNIL